VSPSAKPIITAIRLLETVDLQATHRATLSSVFVAFSLYVGFRVAAATTKLPNHRQPAPEISVSRWDL